MNDRSSSLDRRTACIPEAQSASINQVVRFTLPKWLRIPGLLAGLAWRNRTARDSLIAPDGPVVSLTSYGRRIATAFYTIESIGRGTLKPSRLVLWLSHADIAQGIPASLRRLQKRGLTIQACHDWGPHKKYYPEIANVRSEGPLVTADDDVLYPVWWLEQLVASWKREPSMIHCYRARRIRCAPDGQLLPYRSWRGCRSTDPSHLNFSVGGSGVLYPPHMREALRERGTAFEVCCPHADDVWLNATALRSGTLVRQVMDTPMRFDDLPGARSGGLARVNVKGGGNDRQIASTYWPEDLARLSHLASTQHPLPARHEQ